MGLARARALLAGLWAGQLLCVAAMAAPNAFATLERAQAGTYVSRLFSMDATLSLALGLLLVMMARRLQRDATPDGQTAPVMTAELLLPLLALLCTVAGYYALQPLMEAARAGQGALSFGALHGISMLLFSAKTLAVLALAWRTARA
jgi:hypothetical protein